MPEDKKKTRMLIEENIVVTQLLHNNCLSFRQLKCGESHMTYLARNTVNTQYCSQLYFSLSQELMYVPSSDTWFIINLNRKNIFYILDTHILCCTQYYDLLMQERTPYFE